MTHPAVSAPLSGVQPIATDDRIAQRALAIRLALDSVLENLGAACLTAIIVVVFSGVISRYAFNASFSWTQPLWGSDRLVPEVDYSYVGRSFSANNINGLNGFSTRERPGYDVFNAHLAFNHNDWELALVAKNLTNMHANLADSRSIGAETAGRPRLVVNQPRTIGLEFRTHF